MEVIVNSNKLKKQINSLQGVLSKKGTIPVLSSIKIVAGDAGDLVMTATDLDVSLVSSEEVDILQTGSICLSGRKLGQIIGALPNEPVHLKLNYKSEKVEFLAGSFKGKLAGIDTDQFPEIVRVQGESLKVSASAFYEGLRRTRFAVTGSGNRFTINGILLLIESGELKMVSTDGARLCLYKVVVASKDMPDMSLLIPIKAASELMKILSGELKTDKKAEISIKKGSQLEFEIGSKLMLAREVTGNFPDWQKVVPDNFESFVEINSGEFLDALVRVAVLADNQNRPVELEFFSDKVRLSAESSEVGMSSEEVGCRFWFLEEKDQKGNIENLKVSFNAKYLVDFFSLHGVKSKDFRAIWKFSENNSQVLLTFEGEEKIFSYILVPLK